MSAPVVAPYDYPTRRAATPVRPGLPVPCSVCGNDCHRRCTKCQVTYYCSIHCQRVDWRAGHRRSCGTIGPTISPLLRSATPSGSTANPETALMELCALAKQTPLEVSIRQMSQAQAQVEQQLVLHDTRRKSRQGGEEDEQEKKTDTRDVAKRDDEDGTTPTAGSRSHNPTQQSYAVMIPNAVSAPILDPASSKLDGTGATELPLPSSSPPPPSMKKNVSFVAEEMPQIGRYQLTLRIATTDQHDNGTGEEDSCLLPAEITVSTMATTPSKSHTLVVVQEKENTTSRDDDPEANGSSSSPREALFVGEFPQPIEASQITWQWEDGHDKPTQDGSAGTSKYTTVRFCFPFPPDPSAGDSSTARTSTSGTTSLMDVNAVACGSCQLPLLDASSAPSLSLSSSSPETPATNGGRIDRVLPLPVGHWDDIADTLICYSGVSGNHSSNSWMS
jgi:hypothetical protein